MRAALEHARIAIVEPEVDRGQRPEAQRADEPEVVAQNAKRPYNVFAEGAVERVPALRRAT